MRECASILGVTQSLPQDHRTAKHVLDHIFSKIVEFKKLNQVSYYISAFTSSQRMKDIPCQV